MGWLWPYRASRKGGVLAMCLSYKNRYVCSYHIAMELSLINIAGVGGFNQVLHVRIEDESFNGLVSYHSMGFLECYNSLGNTITLIITSQFLLSFAL